jgi:hypothetical protein
MMLVAQKNGKKKLSESERPERFNSSIKEFTIEHGKMEFEKLTDEQKKSLFLFIWVGCGMHKDMNAGKGGDAAMEECWKVLLLHGKRNWQTYQLSRHK